MNYAQYFCLRINSNILPRCTIMRLRSLAIQLSKLEQIANKKSVLEQYQTEGEIAARWLFDILAFNDILPGCKVVDLGSGNGILGIGAALVGAESVSLVEIDKESCKISQRNIESLDLLNRISVFNSDITDIDDSKICPDIVISNPPWGRQIIGADRPFLESILSLGVNSHLMHSAEATHIDNFFNHYGWSTEKYAEFDFSLPAEYSHHTKQRGRTRASLWRITPP